MSDAPARISMGNPLTGEVKEYLAADLIDMDVLARVEARMTAVVEACDRARMHPRPGCGIGGMTIEANVRGSVYSGVDAWPVEEARDALTALRAMMEKLK